MLRRFTRPRAFRPGVAPATLAVMLSGLLSLMVGAIPDCGHAEPSVPDVHWVSPGPYDSLLYSPFELWAIETTGSADISYIVFEYSDGGPFTEIGLVFDGTSAIRNGVDPTQEGTGYSLPWDFSDLAEGEYTLRATAVDDFGHTASATRAVYLEPTPPTPTITSPDNWDWFCEAAYFMMQCPDEDLSFIELKGRAVPEVYRVNLTTVDQSLLGDVDGDAFDGNSVAEGEYGDYYSGPAAAAMMLRLWFERGYVDALTRGATTLNVLQVAESLAVFVRTRENLGTSDDWMISGLSSYSESYGSELRTSYKRNPSYLDLRTALQDYQFGVILGLGGSPGFWIGLDGFSDWSSGDGTHTIKVSNPLSGSIETVTLREAGTSAEVYIEGAWHPIGIMVGTIAHDWQIPYLVSLGADLNGADGWSFTWVPPYLTEGDHFFIRAITRDSKGYSARESVLLQYNCQSQYEVGDFNNDGLTDAADVYHLIQYITLGGAEPVGGAQRADTNCDSSINIADIVYFLNYLYRSGSPPCD